jgi:hypothetical protein
MTKKSFMDEKKSFMKKGAFSKKLSEIYEKKLSTV